MQFNRDDLLALSAIILLFAILSLPGDWVIVLRDWLKSLINLPPRPPSPSWFPTDKVVHVILFLATASLSVSSRPPTVMTPVEMPQTCLAIINVTPANGACD